MAKAAFAFALMLGAVSGVNISPVQKVVELLEQCKAKVAKDLAAEEKAMDEYTTFCDNEAKERTYNIETAARQIMDLEATMEDGKATIAELEDEITTLGTEAGAKDRELNSATNMRETGKATFVASESEMLKSIDELSRAVEMLKANSAALLQGKSVTKIQDMVNAVSAVVDSSSVDAALKGKLASLLQAAKRGQAGLEQDDDFDKKERKYALAQEDETSAPKAAAFESSTGGIVDTVVAMQEKAEDTLSELRKKEMADQNSYSLIAAGLTRDISHIKEKLADATQNKATSMQKQEQAGSKLSETQTSKAADEEFLATLRTDCQTKASEWEQRESSANEEMSVIDKAKEILVSGVKAFVQVSEQTRRAKWDQVQVGNKAVRKEFSQALRRLSRKYHNFALSQIAAKAMSDPFVKVRGMCEEMIAKLMKEAEEEATQEAFCQTEIAKSKKAQETKQAGLDKFKARIDTATTSIAELTRSIETLTAEVATIDSTQAEASSIRNAENAEYKKASADYKQSAEAVAKAIDVLKSYYEGSFVQVAAIRSVRKSSGGQPTFGSAKSGSASSIVSILEMSREDFTSLLEECESEESEAAAAYDKLTNENKISKAAKETEIKAKESEVKSLKVALENAQEDHSGVQQEMDAVMAYFEELKPQCETKVVDYAARKAAREQEIEGLKNALEILSGQGLALAQTGRHLRSTRRA
jgi:hypothetical protein